MVSANTIVLQKQSLSMFDADSSNTVHAKEAQQIWHQILDCP